MKKNAYEKLSAHWNQGEQDESLNIIHNNLKALNVLRADPQKIMSELAKMVKNEWDFDTQKTTSILKNTASMMKKASLER